MAEIVVKGIDELLDKFGKLGTLDILRDPIQRGLYRLQRDMADYPPQRPGSTYRRTGTLGRRWTSTPATVTTVDDGIEGRIGNNTIYAPFVQSAQSQRRAFRGRWQTDEQVVKRNEQAIRDDLDRTVQSILED